MTLSPKFAKGYARLANAQRHLGKMKEAMESLERGAKIDAGNAEINRLLREMKKETGNASQGNRQPKALPPAVSKELEELQPQFRNVTRELDQIAMKLQAFGRDRKRCFSFVRPSNLMKTQDISFSCSTILVD